MRETFWPGRLITDLLDQNLARSPDKVAVVSYSTDGSLQRSSVTFAELAAWADRFGAALRAAGVRPGDVVSIQLPNCWQIAALHLACVKVGAVTNLLMPMFRVRDLAFMLNLCRSKVLICPSRFRGYEYGPMAKQVRAAVSSLQQVFPVDMLAEDDGSLTELLDAIRPQSAPAPVARARVDPDDVIQVAFTSGTTGEPKGVMVTSNTLLGNVLAFCDRLELGADDVFFMASPLAHQTGFMYGLLSPLCIGATTVVQDAWNPSLGLDIIAREGATFSMGAPAFLYDLTAAVEESQRQVKSLALFVAAGAPVARPVLERAERVLDLRVIRGWGMTEVGAVSLSAPGDDPDKVASSDGRALPGVELEIFESSGLPMPRGTEGILKVRSPSMFGGYLDRPEFRGLDGDGWFDTGDLGVVDAEGFLRITGRAKDLVIRGGENIPVIEVERLIHTHPAVRDVAIVGAPDERLGERACAFVVLGVEHTLTLAELSEFLEKCCLPKQYLPEHLVLLNTLPTTPTGKVQRFALREKAAELFAAGTHRNG